MRLLGAVLVIAACGGCGFSLAASQLREERMLRSLQKVILLMESELRYRMTPLPELTAMAAKGAGGALRKILVQFSDELRNTALPDAGSCMRLVLQGHPDLPERMAFLLADLGMGLGRFDLCGQLRQLEALEERCRGELGELASGRDGRLRSYRILGLCAGASLAILLL